MQAFFGVAMPILTSLLLVNALVQPYLIIRDYFNYRSPHFCEPPEFQLECWAWKLILSPKTCASTCANILAR